MFTMALREVRAATYGVVSQLAPITALTLGVLAYRDPINSMMLVGSAITVSGVAYSVYASAHRG